MVLIFVCLNIFVFLYLGNLVEEFLVQFEKNVVNKKNHFCDILFKHCDIL